MESEFKASQEIHLIFKHEMCCSEMLLFARQNNMICKRKIDENLKKIFFLLICDIKKPEKREST